MEPIPCPFVYANGKICTGHITRFEMYHARMRWENNEDDWVFSFQEGTHYHLYCSEKGNHAGFKKGDDYRMKFWYDQLPDEIQSLIERTGLRGE